MPIPTEPIGSIPRTPELLAALAAHGEGRLSDAELEAHYEAAVRDTIRALEETGSPVVTDGEQSKPSFVTYPLSGATNLAPGGLTITFEDGHTRRLPLLTAGPFRYGVHASEYLQTAQRFTTRPVKQAVISASALSLIYPEGGIEGYPREKFIYDLVAEAQADIRTALILGAHRVQIDFTEGRLAVKLDPSKALLKSFLALISQVLSVFSPVQRSRIAIHTCPGGDQDSTHSLDADYAQLLPDLFALPVGSFLVQLASEPDRERVLSVIRDHLPPTGRVFVGVIDPIDPRIETAEEVRDRVLDAARFIPLPRLGTCDDCGFAPFGDDTSTPRATAFAKITARVQGTALASEALGA